MVENEVFVNTTKHEDAIPLSAYGDGMKRALVIMSAIANVKNGLVLIDEFDTSFNRAAMKNVFDYIVKTAIENRVQLFLSSHNEQAILELLGINSDVRSKVNVYTLFEKKDVQRVRRLTGEKALDVSSWGVRL